MAARGLLSNPALFHRNRYMDPPLEVATEYLDAALRYGPPSGFSILHHHLGYMLHKKLSSTDRKEFNECMSVPSLCDLLRYRGMPLLCGNRCLGE